MDYEKIYNDAFRKANSEIENYVEEFLTSEENSIYFFNENYNTLRKIHEGEYQVDKFNKNDIYIELYVEFERNRKIIKNDSINKALKLKVLPLFEKKKDQIPQSFEILITEIATFNAKNDAFRLLANNNILFENIYKSENYSRFEIKDYDRVLEETEIFIYYDKIVYPYKYESIKEQTNIIEINTSQLNNINENDIMESVYEKELAYKVSILDEDEKLLILHSLYSVIDKYRYEKKTINCAEFLRTILICQGLKDSNIFQEKYTTKFYSNIIKGLDYFTNTKYKRELVDSTLKKIKDFKIPEVEKYIKDLR